MSNFIETKIPTNWSLDSFMICNISGFKRQNLTLRHLCMVVRQRCKNKQTQTPTSSKLLNKIWQMVKNSLLLQDTGMKVHPVMYGIKTFYSFIPRTCEVFFQTLIWTNDIQSNPLKIFLYTVSRLKPCSMNKYKGLKL